MSIHLVVALDGPVVGKGRPRVSTANGFARLYPDGKTVKYEGQLRLAAMQQMAGRGPTIQPVRALVTVHLQIMPSWTQREQAAARLGHIYPIKRNSGDADNYLKILDAFNGIVWVDDSQIVEALVRKVYADQPSLRIEISTMEPPALPAVSARDAPRPGGDLLATLSPP